MQLIKIEYKKHFVSGNLAGLAVDCYFHAPTSSEAMWRKKLEDCKPDHPAADTGGSGQFYTSDIRISHA